MGEMWRGACTSMAIRILLKTRRGLSLKAVAAALLALLAAASWHGSASLAQSRDSGLYAVLVGVSKYQPPVTGLDYPSQDATEMRDILRTHTRAANLRLLVDEQATADNILAAMDDLFSRAKPEDSVVLYFSGHGNVGYVFAHDGALPFSRMKPIFKKSKAKRKLIFADACHTGAFRKPKSEAGAGRAAGPGDNVLLFLSSRDDQFSREDSLLKNGVFTHFLAAGLRGGADANRDRVVTARELFDFVNSKVRAQTRTNEHPDGAQVPVMWGKFPDDMPVLDWNRKN